MVVGGFRTCINRPSVPQDERGERTSIEFSCLPTRTLLNKTRDSQHLCTAHHDLRSGSMVEARR
jgi:hypothetical protein